MLPDLEYRKTLNAFGEATKSISRLENYCNACTKCGTGNEYSLLQARLECILIALEEQINYYEELFKTFEVLEYNRHVMAQQQGEKQ